MTLQEQYDDGMFDFSQGEFDSAIGKFESILREEPQHFDAQLSLGMAHYRKGDFARAIEEGHKAEKLKPHEQLVHTNLSLFYMRSGDKKTAEHHGLQARIAGWRTEAAEQKAGVVSGTGAAGVGAVDPELAMAKPPAGAPLKLPDMPWKKKKEGG